MSADLTTQRPGRQGIPGARSPFPLADHVPAMLADDPMVVAFLKALDEVWAPVISSLDCFDAYLDPRLAPPDMVAYLGSWIRAMTADARDEAQLRHDVATAFQTAEWCGTEVGLRMYMVPRGAEDVEVRDPGGIQTSAVATDPASWSEPEDRTIGITIIGPHMVGSRGDERLRRMVRDLVPAHIPIDLQVR
jgi:phage tail-like protein